MTVPAYRDDRGRCHHDRGGTMDQRTPPPASYGSSSYPLVRQYRDDWRYGGGNLPPLGRRTPRSPEYTSGHISRPCQSTRVHLRPIRKIRGIFGEAIRERPLIIKELDPYAIGSGPYDPYGLFLNHFRCGRPDLGSQQFHDALPGEPDAGRGTGSFRYLPTVTQTQRSP
jgi:hypothetical protein